MNLEEKDEDSDEVSCASHFESSSNLFEELLSNPEKMEVLKKKMNGFVSFFPFFCLFHLAL